MQCAIFIDQKRNRNLERASPPCVLCPGARASRISACILPFTYGGSGCVLYRMSDVVESMGDGGGGPVWGGSARSRGVHASLFSCTSRPGRGPGGRRKSRYARHQKGVVLPVTCKPFNLRTPGNVGNSELGTRSREYSYSWVPHAALVILSI